MENKGRLGFFSVLFFIFYIVLPSYFAVEISSSLPLMTASRIILLMVIIIYIIKNNGVIKFKIFEDKRIGRNVKIYFILLIIANLYYITTLSDSLKEIFSIFLEEICVIWIITQMVDSKEKLIQALDIIVTTAAVVAFISIIGVFMGNNFFYSLNTVNREMLMANYSRLGMLRAEAGFGHAVYYGAYNVMMIPIIMYLIENKGKSLKYTICLILCIVALILANSRGSMIVFGIMLIYMLLKKNINKLGKYLPFIGLGVMGVLVLFLIKPDTIELIGNIWTSITNVFSSDTVEIEEYGTNANGLDSRMMQLSQLTWTAKNNFFFGLGASAQNRDAVKYLNASGDWVTINTFDVGYIAIFCQYGFIGSIAYLVLYVTILIVVFKRKFKNDEVMKMFRFIFVAYLLCLISITGVRSVFWVMFGLMIAYINIINKEEKKCDE